MTAKTQKNTIILITVVACAFMIVVDAIIQPGYFIKSVIKIALFLIFPFSFSIISKYSLKSLFIPDKKGFLTAILMGVGVYAVVLSAFLIFRNVFDFSALTTSLTSTTGVNADNFIFVAIYISFANSLLEEFFFRGFSFLTLKNLSSRKFAYVFSAAFFAIYHIAMMIGWFSLPVILLALAGLFAG